MARVELRHCTIRLKDGLAGTALVNQPVTAPMSGDTSLTIDAVDLNADVSDKVPVGARFKIAGETAADTVHVVTARTPSSSAPTTQITFTPALSAGTYADNGLVTFQAQELEIKLGEGELKYTENVNYNYDLDRGNLDTVREGDEAPMDVSLAFTYEHIATGTGESISPMEAIKRTGSATEWVSAADDKCEPYAVDIEIEDDRPCVTGQREITLFPDFRADKREIDFKNASITISGRCNATAPIVSRVD